jgi:uracil-DNA glycosylase
MPTQADAEAAVEESTAKVLIVGATSVEATSVADLATTLATSGDAKTLLEKMLAAIGLSLNEDCCTATVANCRAVLETRRPKVILALGVPPEELSGLGAPVLATFHPNEILANEQLKRPAWEDLKQLKLKLESFSSYT